MDAKDPIIDDEGLESSDSEPMTWARAREMEPIVIPRKALVWQSRRNFLLYGAGALLTGAGFWELLPQQTQIQLGDKNAAFSRRKQLILNTALNLDDDVSKFLYSKSHLAPTYPESRALSQKNFRVNYEEGAPNLLYGNYVPHWKLNVSGLASGKTVTLRMPEINSLIAHYGRQSQVTQLVCVEGWSVIGSWSGLRFSDFMRAFPPIAGAKWVELRADFNVGQDGFGETIADPYYVSLDIPTALHPQALLATEQSGQPLDIGHGAPLRLRVPMKLGLKNIKAITQIRYTVDQPKDYWSAFRNTENARGYSRYDGL